MNNSIVDLLVFSVPTWPWIAAGGILAMFAVISLAGRRPSVYGTRN